MVIVVDQTGVRIDGPEDLKRFHVAAPVGLDVGAALQAAGFGRMDGGAADAFVSVAAVRAAVAGRVADGWADQFEGMLGYARSKGWLDDTGSFIQAHVERT